MLGSGGGSWLHNTCSRDLRHILSLRDLSDHVAQLTGLVGGLVVGVRPGIGRVVVLLLIGCEVVCIPAAALRVLDQVVELYLHVAPCSSILLVHLIVCHQSLRLFWPY